MTSSSVQPGTGTVLGRRYALDRTPGTSWLTITLDGRPVTASAVGAVTIRHGRTEADQLPTPGTCQLILHADALEQLPSIGSALRIELTDLALDTLELTGTDRTAALVRFAGDLTDAALYRAAGDPRTDAYLSMVAVGPAARLGRATIGDEPWPAERDGDRAARILTLASRSTGAPVRTIDAGTVTVLAADVDSRPPLELLAELALASRGQLHLSRDGSLSWHDAGHRRADAAVATLTAGNVLASSGWSLDLAGAVNDVTVGYGAAIDGAEQATARVVDPVSVGRYGRLGARLASTLTGASDAAGLAAQLVARRASPDWRLGELSLDLARTVDPATAGQLLTAEPGARLTLTGLPAWAPAATQDVYAEGWAETIRRDSWAISYDTVPYGLLSVGPRWIDLDPLLAWDEVPADLSWLDLAPAGAL